MGVCLMRTCLLLLSMLLLQPAPPELRATWEGTNARLVWASRATSVCLDRLPASGGSHFLGCYKGRGSLVLPGKAGPVDHAFHPQPGDRYCMDAGLAFVCAPLLWRVNLPLVRAGEGQGYRVSLPLILHGDL